MSDVISAKAQRLIDEDRTHVISCDPGKCWVGAVEGLTGPYLVTVVDPALLGVHCPCASCTCTGWAMSRRCSHVEAAVQLLVESELSSSGAGTSGPGAVALHTARAVVPSPLSRGAAAHQLQDAS